MKIARHSKIIELIHRYDIEIISSAESIMLLVFNVCGQMGVTTIKDATGETIGPDSPI